MFHSFQKAGATNEKQHTSENDVLNLRIFSKKE
jgi:hypothetical protein